MGNHKTPQPGDLQVWWIPQVPGKPFVVDVESAKEAKKLLDILADYDLFQYKQRIKPDYANAGGLNTWEPDGRGGWEWATWYSEDGRDIDEVESEEL